jgi:hypothetical protein
LGVVQWIWVCGRWIGSLRMSVRISEHTLITVVRRNRSSLSEWIAGSI